MIDIIKDTTSFILGLTLGTVVLLIVLPWLIRGYIWYLDKILGGRIE